MKSKKLAALLLTTALAVGTLAGCGDSAANDGSAAAGDSAVEATDDGAASAFVAIDPNIEGEISIMVWSGDGQYHEDIGRKDWAPEDITAQNVASVYAMAKKFNETYPNVKINLYAKSGDQNGNDTSWAQEMENFKAQHGKYPDIWASDNLIWDVEKGLVADLSVFADDPVYQSFNPTIMEMMNYYGMQAGLPQFIQPWGVFVNTELAEQNNIDVPDPDWTIDDYTDFISQGNKETFWGSMDIPLSWINTGTQDINYSLANHANGDATYVNLDSDAVKSMLDLVPTWADNTIWCQNDVGGVPQEVMDDGWWWSYHFFVRQYCLVNDGDPWMMGDAANPEITDATCNFEFDIYPRPATDYCDNTVGIVLDPMAIHNYAMDDGDPTLSAEEEQQLKLAYTFGTYWCASTEAMQARADQQWNSGGALKTALNDSLPLVTGEEFDKQMEIWYSVPIHASYAEKEGWNAVLDIWENGQMWDVSDKAYPLTILEEGVEKACMYEWTYYYQDDNMTAKRAADGWLDEIKSKLPEWNTKANERFALAEQQLRTALTDFYGYTEADFAE
uniref:hypothetical protein n=1 Tax=Acetatifactor sp. TaxID=1872090 RepID=UPI004055ED37